MVCFHVFAKPHSRQIHESYTTSALSLPSSLFNSQSPVRPSGVQLCASRMVWRDEGSLVAQPLLAVLLHQSAVTNHLSRVTNYVFPSSAKNRYFPYGPKCPTSRLPSTSCARLIKRRAMNRGSGLRIGRILGIPIYLHSTWVFIFAAITYIIASQFKQQHPLWTDTQHWTVGVLTSLLFFASVLFHELGHSVVAQHYKIRVVSITLFLFGGLARIEREPSNAIQEFNIAIAGPLASGFLAGSFFGLTLLFPYSQTVGALATWLCRTNAALAVFNLLPGFPLDGGRIFRAIVWGATKNFEKATRIAARSGQVVAYGLIAVGAISAFYGYKSNGDMINGMWLAFIGWFLLTTARQSRAQADARGALEGLRVSDIMTAELPTVGREISLEDYAREILRTGRKAHLVVAHEQLVGLMTAEALHSVPQQDWDVTSVQ